MTPEEPMKTQENHVSLLSDELIGKLTCGVVDASLESFQEYIMNMARELRARRATQSAQAPLESEIFALRQRLAQAHTERDQALADLERVRTDLGGCNAEQAATISQQQDSLDRARSERFYAQRERDVFKRSRDAARLSAEAARTDMRAAITRANDAEHRDNGQQVLHAALDRAGVPVGIGGLADRLSMLIQGRDAARADARDWMNQYNGTGHNANALREIGDAVSRAMQDLGLTDLPGDCHLADRVRNLCSHARLMTANSKGLAGELAAVRKLVTTLSDNARTVFVQAMEAAGMIVNEIEWTSK